MPREASQHLHQIHQEQQNAAQKHQHQQGWSQQHARHETKPHPPALPQDYQMRWWYLLPSEATTKSGHVILIKCFYTLPLSPKKLVSNNQKLLSWNDRRERPSTGENGPQQARTALFKEITVPFQWSLGPPALWPPPRACFCLGFLCLGFVLLC